MSNLPSVLKTGENTPSAIVPSTVADVQLLAEYFVSSDLIPKSLNKQSVEKTVPAVCGVILYGLELGITPGNALRSICSINGTPTLYGDGALALALKSGLVENIDQGVKGDGDDRYGYCTIKRKGMKEHTVTYSVAEAKDAGLWNPAKGGPWKSHPGRMLKMRAQIWALRDKFADVFFGMPLYEEMADHERTENSNEDYAEFDVIEEPAKEKRSTPKRRTKASVKKEPEQESDLLSELEENHKEPSKTEKARVWEAKTADGEILSFKKEDEMIDKLIEAINGQSTYDQAKFFADQYKHPEVMEVFNQKFSEEAADY